ncbi:MAG: carbohydrate binding domain-containing protein [Clostridia bacterium]|nr:carbohydrate binding domain-containing protein [Clostridia bacterium]MBQ8637484.1 carbohydrate binding domain-containing protein [Clostridia bacterium]
MKRILSFVLVAAMLLAFMPTTYAAPVNMIKNPGFETDTSWWEPSGVSVIRQASAAAVGGYGAFCTVTSEWGGLNTPVINFKKGVAYTVSARVKLVAGTGNRNARFITTHAPGGNGEPKWIEFSNTGINDKDWTLITGSFCYQGTNKTGKATLQLRVGNGQELLSYYLDDFAVYSSETTNYRETEYADGEMVENRGFDMGTDAWQAKNGATISKAVGQGYDGSEASGLVTSNGNGYVGVQLDFVQGQKYDMSAFLKTEGSAAFFTLFVKHNDGSNEQVALLYPSDKDWNLLSGQYLHKRADESAFVYVSSNNTDSYYIDELSVIPTGAKQELVKDDFGANASGVVVDGIMTDVPVASVDGTVLAPVIELAYNINGVAVQENGAVVLKRGLNVIKVKEGAATISVNGKERKVTVPARVIDGKLYADATMIATSLGVKAEIQGDALVVIKTPEGGKLNFTARKLREEKSLTVGLLTSSYAQRSGTYDPYIVPAKNAIESWFKRNYADCSINLVESDSSSNGIMLAAFRAKKFVEENNVDLLLVDVYRNDVDITADEAEGYAATLVRAVREANSSADIVFLYTLSQDAYDNYYFDGQKPESYDGYEKIATVYSIPSVDLGETLIKEMSRTGKKFTSYHNNTFNPNTDGNAVYADGIISLIKNCLANSDEKIELISRNHAKSFGAKIDAVDSAKLGEGWSKVDKKLSAAETNSYIEANAIGAEMEYTFNGNIIGIYFESNPKSGDILYSIDNGAYKSFSTFDKHSYRFEHMSAKILEKDLSKGQHTLKIKVAATKNEEAKDTLIRIGGFLVGNK